MAPGKALNGKPYAGNPHVRFDEGEVASAVTPRRGSLLYRTIKITMAAVACALAVGTAQGRTALASCAAFADIDVTAYGAKADGTADNTAAIQKAIDACSAKGGGRVVVPGGGTYVTYTLNLKNNVELHIDRGATLLGGEDPYKYPEFQENDVWNAARAPRFNRRALFYTVGQTNVAITGAGTIDGNAEKFHHRTEDRNWTGYNWWRNSDTNITGRCVFFVECRDVRLDDVLIYHPSGWGTWFLGCDRVGVRGVRIEADKRFPNGDGLHFGGCRDVVVSDCVVESQDDAFILRNHQEQMKKPRPCERMVVNNCIFNSAGAYAIRVGWRGDGPLKNVSFNNIVSTHSRGGVSFTVPNAPKGEDKDPPRGRGIEPPPAESLLPFSAENIRFSNMDITCDNPVRLVAFGRTTPIAYVKNISFSHCRFKAPGAPFVKFSPEHGVRDWSFSDVEFVGGDDAKLTPQEIFKDIRNAEFDNVRIVCSDVVKRPLFWQMLLEKEVNAGQPPREVTVEGAGQIVRVECPSADVTRYFYEGVKAGSEVFNIRIAIEKRNTERGVSYAGTIENNEKGVRIVSFNGPKLDAVDIDPDKAYFYVPTGFGSRIAFRSDGKSVAPWEGNRAFRYYKTRLYPSRALTMPWVALDTGNGTYYAAVHDPMAMAKMIGMRWHHRANLADVRFRHLVSIKTGDSWKLPDTVFERMAGDWHEAAKRYRAWYDATHPAVLSAVPKWPGDLTGWLLVIMKQQNEELMWPYTDIPKLCDVAERNGLNCIGLFGWTVGGHDHLYPDYDPDPKMGGVPALKAGIAEAHRRGIRVCIYANGQLQQIGATKFWDEHGKNIALTRRDGSFLVQTYHKYRNIPVYQFALGCLYGSAWSERMSALARQAAGFGADAILYDQQGVMCPLECWGEGHGHPTPWYSFAQERPAFLRNIADGIRKENPSFSIFTEGLHDSILDSIGVFHSYTPGAFKRDALDVRGRDEGKANLCAFPEIFRYTFPETVLTTRFPTPMEPRYLANYATVFGLRHEIEIRYMPDREYVLDGKVPTKADYGEVRNLPDIGEMQATPQKTANTYLKAVCDFQRKYAKYLLRGTFVDDEGFSVQGKGLVAKRFVADDCSSAVCVWNVADKPVPVAINGLGAPASATEPEAGVVAPDTPLAPDTLRLYRFAR